jgi:hypothetical protein
VQVPTQVDELLTVNVYVEFPLQFVNGSEELVTSFKLGEGDCDTVTVPVLGVVPFGLVTLILPVPAEFAVAVIIVLALFTTNVAAEPAILTALTLVKFVPVIVIWSPVQIWFGVYDVIVGA